MKISTKGRYAVRALTYIAEKTKKEKIPVSINEISREENISNRYLENIFVKLRKANIVKSIKGEKGGFLLTKNPENISLFEILKSVEKDVVPVGCVINEKFCKNTKNCKVRKVWIGLYKKTKKYLESIKLSEIITLNINNI